MSSYRACRLFIPTATSRIFYVAHRQAQHCHMLDFIPYSAACLSTAKRLIAHSGKKRARGSYAIYISENFNQLKLQNPECEGSTSIMKLAANAWRDLSSEDKQVYEDKARLEKEVIDAEYDQLTDEERQELVENKQMRLDKRYSASLKKEKKASGKPTQPRSRWALFFRDQKSAGTFEGMKKLKEDYDNLSFERKRELEDMVEQDRYRYEQEMREWVPKVLSEGHDHLVSKGLKNKYL